MSTDNGILAWVPGDCIGAAANQLPRAGQAQPDQRDADVVVEVPDLGAVRITFRLNAYRHGRSRLWHWTAVRADLVLP